MAETLYAAQTPSDGGNDANSNNQGNRFQIGASGFDVTHGRVWVKTGGLPTTSKVWQLWNADTATLLADFDCTALGSPSDNQWSPWFALASPVTLSTGVNYVVCYHKQGDPGYVFSGQSFPLVNGQITISAGVYTTNEPTTVMPTNTFDALYFADIMAVNADDVAVSLATETDSAFAVTASATADAVVGFSTETDSALVVTPTSTVNRDVALATEVDSAFTITPSGGAPPVTSPGDLSASYFANELAGTLVAGIPQLTQSAALAKWATDQGATNTSGLTDVGALNGMLGNVLPQFESRNQILNEQAGTDDLSDTGALQVLANE